MLHIRFLINKTLKNVKETKSFDVNIIYKEAERVIKKNTPDVEVFFYKNKTLYVNCFNSITANEVFLNQDKIIQEINESLNKNLITKLIIKTK